MNDNELFELFQTGTAPERDQLFAKRVCVELEQSQIVYNFLKKVTYACMTLLIVGCILLAQLYLPFINTVVQGLSESLSSLVAQIIVGVICTIFVFFRKPISY